MGYAFILLTLALDLWIFYSTYRHLSRNEVDRIWKQRVFMLLILGLGLAVYFTFIRRHEIPEKLRLAGFPIPYEIFRFENGEWKNYNPSHVVQLLAKLTDFVTGFAAALLPIKVMAFMKQVKAEVRREP